MPRCGTSQPLRGPGCRVSSVAQLETEAAWATRIPCNVHLGPVTSGRSRWLADPSPSCRAAIFKPADPRTTNAVDDQRMELTILSDAARDRLEEAALTYTEVGATAGELPAAYHHLRRRVMIGRGRQALLDAAADIAGWQVQLRAGLAVAASGPTAIPGAVALLGLGVGPVRLSAPCRVVYAVTESRRRGFAYGTLPGHPESGEEAFIVEHHEDDTVSFTIKAFSKPSTVIARVAGPAGRVVQNWTTTRYLRSLRP
jgi:uncharacterized protein (UPF0548 family)